MNLSKHAKPIAMFSVFYPLLAILSLHAAWLAGRFTLGHWPRPIFDDPKHIGGIVDLFLALSLLVVSGVPLVLFFNIVLNILSCIAYFRWNFWYFLAVSLATWIGSLKFLQWDPLRVAEWFVD
jgi:hypothetical protein